MRGGGKDGGRAPAFPPALRDMEELRAEVGVGRGGFGLGVAVLEVAVITSKKAKWCFDPWHATQFSLLRERSWIRKETVKSGNAVNRDGGLGFGHRPKSSVDK